MTLYRWSIIRGSEGIVREGTLKAKSIEDAMEETYRRNGSEQFLESRGCRVVCVPYSDKPL
jgi:hypothetical protein